MNRPAHGDGSLRAVLAACVAAGLVAAMDAWWSERFFETVLATSVMFDFVIVGYGTLLLLKLQRSSAIGVFIVAVLFVGGTLAMIVKYDVTWSAVSFGDLLLLPDLFGFYGKAPLIGAGAALFAFIALFLFNLRIPRRRELVLFAPALLAAVFLAAQSAIPEVSAEVSGTRLSVRSDRSGPLYLGQWGALGVSTYRYTDQYAEARRLQAAFRGKSSDYADFTALQATDIAPRNVYIVLVESLYDAHEIGGLSFDREPLAAPFDAWFRRGGAHAMSPVFGGRSADAEFEILCGLPADLDYGDVIFARLAAEKVDCLPAKLARLGWSAVSTVPVPGSFFNAEGAYRRIGFTHSIFIDQIDTSDRDGQMVSAQSLLRQQLSIVEGMLAKKQPFLSYVFLTSGHFPYELDEKKRPPVIKVTPPDPQTEAYVNAAYYNTLEVGRYIEAVRQRDPTALIVTLGDHPPVIFSEQKATQYPGQASRTNQIPLMVFDGAKGEVPLTGWIPDYHLPELILSLLTEGRLCAANRCYSAAPYWIRPTVSGVTLIDPADGKLLPCISGAPECEDAVRRLGYWKSRVYSLVGLL